MLLLRPLTTIAILAHCAKAVTAKTGHSTFQPLSLFCFPPLMISRQTMMLANSTTTAKDMRKPTLRHSEQKVRSRWQSSNLGKGSHLPNKEEQRR